MLHDMARPSLRVRLVISPRPGSSPSRLRLEPQCLKAGCPSLSMPLLPIRGAVAE